MTSVTKLFETLEKCGNLTHERHEIISTAFSKMRHNLWAIIQHLSQSEDPEAAEIVKTIRVNIFSWLTSPVMFDSRIPDALLKFGEADVFEKRWGLRGEFKSAIRAAVEMTSENSPLRSKLEEVIRALFSEGKKTKIFCHRRSREQFETINPSCLSAPQGDSVFLHSVRDYANAELFDALIKIGPLRSKGWGASPDALKSAPKFKRLIQIVWSGCSDEPGFGCDPVELSCSYGASPGQPSGEVLGNQILWRKVETKNGQNTDSSQDFYSSQDELSFFNETNSHLPRRRAILLEISNNEGILLPQAEVLSYDPKAANGEFVDLRVPGESIFPGMFVIQTKLGEISFGDTRAQESGYCRTWRQRLNEELLSRPDALFRNLQNKGLRLKNLRNCAKYWAQPPDAVIHAPQQKKHFQILIDALSINPELTQPTKSDTRAWWQKAWDEIRVSRGEAVQTGRQEQELVEQRALELLKGLLPEILNMSASSETFQIQIPPGNDLIGAFVFHKILRIEAGFLAPENEIKIIRDLNTLEEWKVT